MFSLACEWPKHIMRSNVPLLKLGNVRGYTLNDISPIIKLYVNYDKRVHLNLVQDGRAFGYFCVR